MGASLVRDTVGGRLRAAEELSDLLWAVEAADHALGVVTLASAAKATSTVGAGNVSIVYGKAATVTVNVGEAGFRF